MHPDQPRTTAEELSAELDVVQGERCGWTCQHHGDNFPPCQRAQDHAGATRLADMHVARDTDGDLVVAGEECCATDDAPGVAEPAAV